MALRSSLQSSLPMAMPAEQAATMWITLKSAIQQIQNGGASELRYEELYRYIARLFVFLGSM